MRVATEEFFSVGHSCCCLTGLGLGLNILVLFPSLTFSVDFDFNASVDEPLDAVHAADISDARAVSQSDDVVINGTWETNVFVPDKLTRCT